MDHVHHPTPDSPEDTVDKPLIEVATTTKPPSPISRTNDKVITHIVDDILYCRANNLPIYNTYFYKVVLGGHVDTVKQVVQCMEQEDKFTVLSWLLGTSKEFVYRKYFTPIKMASQLQIARYGIFLVTAVLCIIVSPVFYMVHGFLATMLRQKKASLSENIELPLAFVAYSQSPEMIKFFFSKNVSLKSTDQHGNNVFHYIANLSITSSGSACAAFSTLMDSIQADFDLLYPLMFEKRNSSGVTALESVAQFGAPSLLTRMMNAEPRLRQIRFSVMDEGVMLKPFRLDQSTSSSMLSLSTINDHDDSEDKPDSRDRQTAAAAASTREDYINVTMYESQNLARRSLLLRFIAGRNVSSFAVKDLSLFHKCPVIGKWIQLKVKEMWKYIVSVYVLDLVVTAIFLAMLFLMHGNTDFNLQLSKKAMRVELEEYQARALRSSSILTDSALQNITEVQVLNIQLKWIVANVHSDLLEEKISSEFKIHLPVSEIFSLNTTLQSSIVEFMLGLQPPTRFTMASLNLTEEIAAFTQALVQAYPDLAQREISTNNLHEFEDTVRDFFLEFEVRKGNVSGKLSEVISFDDWRRAICPPTSKIPPEGILRSMGQHPSSHFPDDICSWHSLLVMAEESCKSFTRIQVYQRLDDILSTHFNRQNFIEGGIIFMVVLAVIYVMIDTYEHLLFFFMVISANKSVLEMILSVCSTRVPGSYYRKQLNILTYYVVIFHLCARADVISSHVSSLLLEKYTYYLLLFGLILRFFMHIHCMRLLPWIGHFITTTFMMANNLIHFSTVLGLVIFIFSVIFHLLIVDKDCPVQRYEGYETVGKSMMSVFMLTFGHGDFDQYRSSTPVIATYVLFVVIVGLLLLNLIIAIMSATAEDLMTPEGKATLREIEWLYEALSIEYTVTALAGSINARWLYADHAKSGYQIQGHGKEAKVYIRVFYCDKLD